MDASVDRPNLLYIHSDQHNPHVTGCYGDALVRTPNLDALAAAEVVLDSAYCPSPICVPPLTDPEHTSWDDVVFSEFCLDAVGAGGPFPEEDVIQRMVRRGPWKLNYYHGQPCQLFNLEDDPDELRDLAADPGSRGRRDAMLDEVLEGWDPDWISQRLAALRRDRPLLVDWARHVGPQDRCRWKLRPEMDYLDAEQLS